MEHDQDERQLTMLSRFSSTNGRGDAAEQPVKRAQKNLSLDARDIDRMGQLSKRDSVSQARLVRLALDAYESLHGRLKE